MDPSVILNRMRKDEAMRRIVGEDCGNRSEDIALLRACVRDAQRALAEARALRTHACDWNDKDFCNVCGADGRA